MPTDELTLQYALDLSKNEARVYAMRIEGYSPTEIADMMGLSVQTVNNTMHSVNKKKRDKMHISVVIQDDNTHKAMADMALKVLATDTNNQNLHIGRFQEILFDVDKANIGNVDFITNEVLRQIDPIVHNELEANKKAKEIYSMYLQLGGKKGQMGYGWVVWLFNKFRVKYDILG